MLGRLKDLATRAVKYVYSNSWQGQTDLLAESGTKAATGENITPEKSLRVPAVLQIVRMLSGDLAKMPFVLYKRKTDGLSRWAREQADHVVAYFVQHEPNEDCTAFTFWRRFYVSLLLYGRGYAYIKWDQNQTKVEGIYNLLPDRTEKRMIKDPDTNEIVTIYVSEVNGEMMYFNAWEILHVEDISLDGIDGHPYLQAAREAVGVALAQQEFTSKFFKNGAVAGGILEVPHTFSKEAKDRLQEGFDKRTTGKDGWFRTVILRDNAKFHKVTFSPQDIEMSDQVEAAVRQLCRAWNVPPSRVGLSDSVSYNSRAEDNQAYLDSTLSPFFVACQQELSRKLLSRNERRRLFFQVNSDSILAMSPEARAKVWAIYTRNNIVSPQVVQEAEGLPIVEVQNTDTGGANDQQFDNDTRRLVFEVGARARKKAENPRAFLEWVDSDLKYHREKASKMGVKPAILDEIASECREILENNPADELLSAVERSMAKYESRISI